MHFALPRSRRLSDKEPPEAPDAAINWAGANRPRRSELVSTYESHKEKYYEIDPKSELRQVCCVHGPGGWTQCERVSVVRRFPLRDGSAGCFRTESIPPDATKLSVCRRRRPQIDHRWPLAHPVHGRRSNHSGSVPALECRGDRGSQP